jgi:serine/threonine protein kinase
MIAWWLHLLLSIQSLLITTLVSDFCFQAVDWWSLGVLTYELLTGASPFTVEGEKNTQSEVSRSVSCVIHTVLLSLPNKVWETYCFCSVSYYYFSYYYSSSPFFPWTMNLSTADLRNYWTEFHETWWSYRYMILVGPKVFSFVVKGVKVIFLGLQRGWGLL